MILVLSNMLSPGPEAMQCFAWPSQELETSSQGFPLLMHLGPLMFGETSPRLLEAKAATNGPWKENNFKRGMTLLPIKKVCQDKSNCQSCLEIPFLGWSHEVVWVNATRSLQLYSHNARWLIHEDCGSEVSGFYQNNFILSLGSCSLDYYFD